LAETLNEATKYYTLFGEHNKPTGTYTGNGDATQRIIETGGKGYGAIITCANGTALLFNSSGLAFNPNGIEVIPYAEGKGVGSSITLATTHRLLNAEGVTYTYRII